MASLRTPETDQIYDNHRKGRSSDDCALCRVEGIKVFTYWKIIVNDFPYDRIAQKHDMIVPLRHVAEDGLNEEEKKELYEIKSTYINDHYDYLLEGSVRIKSIPAHFHIHLITIKD